MITTVVPRALLYALALLALAGPAAAAELGPDGQLAFAPDALRSFGFESADEEARANTATLAWAHNGSSLSVLPTALPAARWSDYVVADPRAPEGSHVLRLSQSAGAGLALRDTALFQSLAARRFAVSLWGRSEGAEPVLVVVYGPPRTDLGPWHFARVVAVRTGRERSDGWAEYGTGPLDGTVDGTPVRAVLLSARYTTDDAEGSATLLSDALDPLGSPSTMLDPDGYALIDAVEFRPASGAPTPGSACTLATMDAVCGAQGACVRGHCVDAAVLWGALPPAAERRAAAARWAFQAASLQGDRQSAASSAATGFPVEQLAAATSPRGYFMAFLAATNALRDAHTSLGTPPSNNTLFAPLALSSSAGLDACFVVVHNDLPGGPAAHYAVLAAGTHSPVSETVSAGDLLTAIDGADPDAWLDEAELHYGRLAANDAAANPSLRARHLGALVSSYAASIALARCTDAGCAPPITLAVGEQLHHFSAAHGYLDGYSLACSPRVEAAVAHPPGGGYDVVVSETAGGTASVQLDGFEPDPAHAASTWQMPFTSAFAAPRMLVDTRIGTGGRFWLGEWLFHQLRGTSEPYTTLVLPRGASDDADPAWLLDPAWSRCLDPAVQGNEACSWAGSDLFVTTLSAPPGGATRIAWLVSFDLSMNDIVPRLLQGRANFRVFGPHPTTGAYGEISRVPAIGASWSTGSLQVLDSRFGVDAAAAIAAPWASGHGVVPDQLVVQLESDLLHGRDTILRAARAWLGP